MESRSRAKVVTGPSRGGIGFETVLQLDVAALVSVSFLQGAARTAGIHFTSVSAEVDVAVFEKEGRRKHKQAAPTLALWTPTNESRAHGQLPFHEHGKAQQ